jgi:hypothetical protein
MAIAGLVLGLVAIVLALIPFAGLVLSAIPALLVIIFGAVGLRTSRLLGALRRGSSLAGVWLGVSAVALSIGWYLILLIRVAMAN